MMNKNDVLDKISPNEALVILRTLAKIDKNIEKKIVELAEDWFRAVDADDICEAVFDALDMIDVHELWDRAGPSLDGYASPEDMSMEMFEEALEPFIKEMERLLDLKMLQEARQYCMGILKGIYQYEEDSGSEFKVWAEDLPQETFVDILRQWGKKRSKKDKQEMSKFIKDVCPAWSEWAIKQL